MRHIIVATALFVAVLAPARADFQDGVAASERGDYATALREFLPLAEEGDTDAQYHLGLMYADGHGVSQDHAEAVKWYRMAASRGQADAQFRLGFMYYDGQGVPQNYAEAVTWYRMAANQGQADAQFGLGVIYHNGRILPQDYVQAHLWFNLAAAQGTENAKMNREITAKMMTSAQIIEAQRLARDWQPKKP